MERRRTRRSYLKRSPISRRLLEKWRNRIAKDSPELLRRNRLAARAVKERSLSGALRRAIYRHRFSTTTIAEKVGITWIELDDFLIGEKGIFSDVVDRLGIVLKLNLGPS